MKRRILIALLAAVGLLSSAQPLGGVEGIQAQGPGNAPDHPGPPPLPPVVPVCHPGPDDTARCHSHRRTDVHGQPAPSVFQAAPIGGYSPADLEAAYSVATSYDPLTWAWNGETVAIVDAFDDPNAEQELGVYRAQYGLPPCTTANGCFRKVDQNGGTSYPAVDNGWRQEIALDIQMVSAICPSCKILLVEAANNSYTNLGNGVKRAAALGANAISNSYGGGESPLESFYEAPYNQGHIAVTVSSGDAGYGVEFPAASRYVTAVGGTSLARNGAAFPNTNPPIGCTDSARGWCERAWSGAGSGCSRYIPKPSWQTNAGCSKRTVADVSAVADPYTGVAVYTLAVDSTSTPLGWTIYGGTSVASPIIASVYALAGNAGPSGTIVSGSYPYSHRSSLYDVAGGSNGNCSTAYLCTSVTGYDGPTGLGTPHGWGGF